jgi:hypothetical protein
VDDPAGVGAGVAGLPGVAGDERDEPVLDVFGAAEVGADGDGVGEVAFVVDLDDGVVDGGVVGA